MSFNAFRHLASSRGEKKGGHNHKAGFKCVLTGCHTFVPLGISPHPRRGQDHGRHPPGHKSPWTASFCACDVTADGSKVRQTDALPSPGIKRKGHACQRSLNPFRLLPKAPDSMSLRSIRFHLWPMCTLLVLFINSPSTSVCFMIHFMCRDNSQALLDESFLS